ncbi:hypothetical protein ERJ77_22580 [Vibrio anguillarum]|uniref:Uncharacterized protein n=1 Tax=Vibrio anguillarum TaxID=55601 RepID=A0AAW4BJP4_VIBAN|nr:hypothetical protein [Vibrio anguillarum]
MFIRKTLNETVTASGERDYVANLNHLALLNLMYDNTVNHITFRLTNGVPLVIQPHFPDTATKEEINNPETRNVLPVSKWTLETQALITASNQFSSMDKSYRVKFNFDIITISDTYNVDDLRIERMSLWEIMR